MMADSTEQNDAPSIAAPGAESASNDGSSSDLSASTAGTNGADESRNSGAENYSGMSLAAVEVAFKTALIGLLQHQIEFVAMLKEHRVDEERSNVLTNQARGAADNYPFLVASIQVGLLLAYFFTGAGYYFKILFGFALLVLVADQAKQLYRHVKNTFVKGKGYSKRDYFFLFLMLCSVTPILLIFHKAGFNLWLLAVPSVAYNALQRITRFVVKKKGYGHLETYRGVLFGVSLAILGLRFFIYDDKYSKGDIFVIFFGIIALTGFAFTADSQEFMLFCLVGGTATAAIGINILIDHPCTVCAWESYENAQPIFSEYFGSSAAKPISQMWRILFDDDGYGIPHECGTCFETVSALHRAAQDTTKPFRDGYGAAVGAYEYFFGDSDDVSLPASVEEIEVGDFENDITSDNLRKWNQWYDNLLDEEKVSLSNIESLFVAFASNITTCDGQKKLNEAVHNMMCKSTSRASGGPSPSEFLMQIQQPKFTGEASETGKPMNLPINELKRIIRADDMVKLGSPTCFMQNFVNVLSPNLNVENEIMDPSNIAPIATETELKGEDISYLFPALYVPRTDEDRDPTGESGDITEVRIIGTLAFFVMDLTETLYLIHGFICILSCILSGCFYPVSPASDD